MRPRRRRQPTGPYLENKVSLRVRFQEVDVLQMVWHGHYLSYFEDARVGLGRRYGVNYTDFVDAGILAPIIHVSCDYLCSAKFEDELEVTARLYKQESAKLVYYFEVWRPADNSLLATGQTIQAFADVDGRLRLTMPDFMRVWYARWKDEMQGNNE